MPEGDTLARTARALEDWLGGRTITDVSGQATEEDTRFAALVGRTVLNAQSQGKVLLVQCGDDLTVRSHLRMTGTWHVYSEGEQWRRPVRRARLVLHCGDHLAVCFDTPAVEVLATRDLAVHPTTATLGPDVRDEAFDSRAVAEKAIGTQPTDVIGLALLDQRLAAGIGNIYRNEALFLVGTNPASTLVALGPERVAAAFAKAADLLRANSTKKSDSQRDFGRGRGKFWVYGRAGEPCHTCGTDVDMARQGELSRPTWWCPTCQPLVAADATDR